MAAAVQFKADELEKLVSSAPSGALESAPAARLAAISSQAAVSTLSLMLDKGANVNAALSDKQTPLHYAANFALDNVRC